MNNSGDDEALLDLLCLTMVSGVGPLTSRALLDHFGDAGRVLNASSGSLRQVSGVGPKLADKIARARDDHDPRESNGSAVWIEASARSGSTRRTYPAALKDIPDPPPLLYVRGTLTPADSLSIALVGSRRCTPYGLRIAERLAQSLARVGLTVVSGLARGIDAAAHHGALKAGGRTLAVLANGLDATYPPEHEDLAAEIAQRGAC